MMFSVVVMGRRASKAKYFSQFFENVILLKSSINRKYASTLSYEGSVFQIKLIYIYRVFREEKLIFL